MYESQIVISALGKDKPGIVKSLSKTVLDCGGNISDSRMTRLGEEFALIMLVEGVEKTITAVEEAIQKLHVNDELTVISKRTEIKPSQVESTPYMINVICMDQPGIVHDIADFVSNKHINIEELDTSSYAAAHTGAPMFALDLSISIPAAINTAEFKQELFTFCDELNLDVTIDAIK